MKKFVAVFALALFIMPALMVAVPAGAASETLDKNVLFGGHSENSFGSEEIRTELGGLSDEDPRIVAARIINVLLGFLGIVAVVIVLWGGFKWMMSQGDEGKIDDAKKLIIAGIVGLAIILSAFAIAQFAVDALFSAMAS